MKQTYQFCSSDQSTKTFLITGGTGFIGQLLIKVLLAEQQKIIVLSRNVRKAQQLFGSTVNCVSQLADIPSDHNVDIIINLAGERIVGARWTKAQKEKLLASRVGTTQALQQWLSTRTHKPDLIISGSAVGFYGVQMLDDQSVWDETQLGQSIFVSELCQQWEAAAKAIHQQGIALAILRFGMVLGTTGGAFPAMILPAKFGLGSIVGGGQHILNWIHVEDVIGIMAWLCQQSYSKASVHIYNAVAPETVTQKAFMQTVGQVLHRPVFLPVPAWVLRLLLGEQATILVDGQRVVPKHLLNEGYVFRYPTLKVALQDLLS